MGFRGCRLEENEAGFELELAQASVLYLVGPYVGSCSYYRRTKRKQEASRGRGGDEG